MPGLTCNIDSRGRVFRIVSGILLIGAVALWYLSTADGSSTLLRLAQGLITAAGLFTLFQGAIGWCAFRALGLKTPL